MENIKTPVQCRKCKKVVKFDEVKYDDSSKSYVCQKCFLESRKFNAQKKTLSSNEASLKKEPSKIKYSCGKCKYTYQRASDKSPGKCPYCGSSNVAPAVKDAKKLIDDSKYYDY